MRFYKVQDYHHFSALKKKLRAKPFLTKAERNILRCHSHSKAEGVTILKRGDKVGYHGLLTCNNSWCCPCCAPYRLTRTQRYLEAGFQMLAERGYKCIMITFTVPHSNYFNGYSDLGWRPHLHTLADTFYLLHRTFSQFTKKTRLTRLARRVHTITKKEARYKNETSEKKRREQKYATENTDYYSFYIHEITWGSVNGWHPHIHYLIWLPPANFNYFKTQEENLQKKWKEATLEVLNEMTWLQNNVKNNWKDLINNDKSSTVRGVYFSKNEKGEVREITQNGYFWSGSQEVTALQQKKGHGTNLTSWQILAKALDETNEKHEFYFNLYLEIINAMTGYNVWTFKRGFLQEIKTYMQTHPIDLLQKKKSKPQDSAKEKIKVICWLSQEQWKLLNQEIDYLQIILASFAIQDEAFELIKELCEVFKVGAPMKEPPYGVKVFEKKAA